MNNGETIISVSLGWSHSSAITSDGRIFTWGLNEYGQLGDDTVINTITPTEITSNFGLNIGETITSVSLGGSHSSAITSDGRIFTWGWNEYGQLGDETTTQRNTPTEITSNFSLPIGEIITSVSLGWSHSSVITSEGRVFTWGYNFHGQLGDETKTDRNTPTEITSNFNLDTGETITSISLGGAHSSAITSEGIIFTWGFNGYGQLGDDTVTNTITPTEITSNFGLNSGETIVSISLGGVHSSATTSEGRIFTWGYNNYGQLGDETTTNRNTPIDITNIFNLHTETPVITLPDVILGDIHSSAITPEGKIFTWGHNGYGQLGDGTIISRSIPTEITDNFSLNTGETITDVILKGYHSSAITSEGRVFTWGYNNYGQLGDGTTINQNLPTEITTNFNLNTGEIIIGISLGEFHSSAITSEGRIFTWGLNYYGELGDGTSTTRYLPTDITGNFNLEIGESIISMSLFDSYSSALTSEGRIFMWGKNEKGQLGNETNDYDIHSIPIDITDNFNLNTGEIITKVNLGGSHSSALTSEGRLFTWGWNNHGQLGDGTVINRNTPTQIHFRDLLEGETITDVTLGSVYSSAITSNGRIFTWGYNGYGQLGDETTTSRHTPTEITSNFILNTGEIITQVSLGWNHSSAITSEGRMFTWGNNYHGQLGDGTTTEYDANPTPIDITNGFNLHPETPVITLTDVILGGNFSSAITLEGRLFTWGSNRYGQLGDGTTINKSLPTDITNNFILNTGETITDISLGNSYSSAKTSEGRLFTWGCNVDGQLGDGTTIDKSIPTDITGNFGLNINEIITKFNLGENHSAATTSEGRVFTWGDNGFGRLGDGTYTDRSLPTDITGNFVLNVEETITDVSFGYGHSTAITSEGRVFTWGYNGDGQLGDGTVINTIIPTLINFSDLLDGETITEVNLGWTHSSAITSEGRIFVWGYNGYGQLGDGTRIDKMIPSEITNNFSLDTGEIITELSSGWSHVSVITSEGRIFTWGDNQYGQLGDELTSGSYVNPIPIEVTNSFSTDIEAPVITLTGDVTVYVEYGGTYSENGATFTDNYGASGNAILGGDTVDTSTLGTYTITYNVTDTNGNIATEVTRIVIVQDTTAPVITLTGDSTIYIEYEGTYTESGAKYLDNYDQDGDAIVGGEAVDTSAIGTYIITYNVTDTNSNVATEVTRTVIVQATISPVVTLNTSLDTIEVGDTYTDQGISVEYQTEYQQTITGEVDTTQAGRYVITYTVIDAGLNETVVTRIVNVVNIEPEFVLGNANTSIKVGEGYTDGTCQVIIGTEQFDCTVKENTVNTSVVGLYTITYAYSIGETEYTHSRYVFVYDDNTIPILYYRKDEEGDLV